MPDQHPQRISFSPDPPRAGEDCTICYDFAGSGITSTLLSIDFEDGDTHDTDEQVSAATPCVTITIPALDTIEVIDGSDKSLPAARVISHPDPGGG